MYFAHLFPCHLEARHWEFFTHTSHLVLVGDDIYLETLYLLAETGIVEIGAEESIGGYEGFLSRGETVGTLHEVVYSNHSGIGEHRSEAVFHRKIPPVERGAVAIDFGKFRHYLFLAFENGRDAQVVVLIFSPADAQKRFHAERRGFIEDCRHRAFAVGVVAKRHYLRRIHRLAFVGYRHKHDVFHSHIVHLAHLGTPQCRVGVVHIFGVGILVPHILIEQVYPTAGNGEHIGGLH